MSADSPFMVSSEVKEAPKVYGREYRGRYHLPRPDDPSKHIPWGVMRTTNLVGANVDTRALGLWEMRMALRGLKVSPDLYEELSVMPPDCTDEELDSIIKRAKTAAKANVAANRGTARHTMVETWHSTGEVRGTPAMIVQLEAYTKALRDHLVSPVPGLLERVIYNEKVKAAGKFDLGLWCHQTGRLLMGDLKTKARFFWTLMEVQAQLAVYAHATHLWDPTTQFYVDPPPFDLTEGLVLHMPVDGEEVNLLTIDLVKGWATALRAYEVVRERSDGKSVATLQGAMRPHPTVSLVEAYASRLVNCTTMVEADQVAAEIKRFDLWCPELVQCAQMVARRLLAPVG